MTTKTRFTFILDTTTGNYHISGLTFPPVKTDQELDRVFVEVERTPAFVNAIDVMIPNQLHWVTGIISYDEQYPLVTINEILSTPVV